MDDLRHKSINAFKGNLSRHDIKILRQRQFIIQDASVQQERPKSMAFTRFSMNLSGNSESNKINPYIKHTVFKPNKNLMKQLMMESKREKEKKNKQRMSKFSDIFLDRERAKDVTIPSN